MKRLRVDRFVQGLGPVFTLRRLRRALIYRKSGGLVYGCRLCGDSWRRGEEHHTRCLLSTVQVTP